MSSQSQQINNSTPWRIISSPMVIIMLLALLLRTINIFSSLEYDEIWSWENFSTMPIKEIMSRLALPNNQPLNSLLIKFTLPFASPPALIRWHSLLSGLISIPLCGFLATKLCSSKIAGFWTMLFATLSAPLVVYSQLARGYSLQLFFLLLCATGFIHYEISKNKLAIIAIIIGGVGSILTISSAVMFLLPIVVVLWCERGLTKKPNKSLTMILISGTLFTLAYYLGNYSEIAAGKSWGVPLKSIADFTNFSGELLSKYLPLAWIPLIILGLIAQPNRKLIIIILFPLALSPITNGGPSRVYLPYAAVFAIWAGAGAFYLYNRMANSRRKIFISILVIMLGFCGFFELYPQWVMVDYPQLYHNASNQFSEDKLLIFPATSTYTIAWNSYPAAGKDFRNRLSNPHLNNLVMFGANRCLNGITSNGNETTIPLDFSTSAVVTGFPITAWKYNLTPLTRELQPKDAILALSPDGDPNKIPLFFKLLFANMNAIQLNVFLAPHVPFTPGDNRRYGAFAFIVCDPKLIDKSALQNNFNLYLISGN